MKKIIYYGLWVYLIAIPLGIYLITYFNVTDIKTIETVAISLLLTSVFLNIYIWSQNKIRVSNGKSINKIGLLDAFEQMNDRYATNRGGDECVYPDINPRMLSPYAKDFVFGRDKKTGRFVVRDGDAPGILIIGNTGSGKSSSLIINNLLRNDYKVESNKLVLDIKGELAEKTVRANDESVLIFNPIDRFKGYGWDAFASLTKESTDNDIYNCMNIISLSLIPSTKTGEDFWVLGSRSLLRGLLIYMYQEKEIKTLSAAIKAIFEKSLKDILSDAMLETTSSSKAHSELISYASMPDETLFGLFENMKQRISIFTTDDDVAFAFGDNPRKVKPEDLRDYSIFLNIPKERLKEWAQMILLIYNQTFHWGLSLCEISEEPTRKHIDIYLDELGALMSGSGPISELPQLLRLGRSVGFTIVLSTQSIASLKISMDDDSVNDLISNCGYKVFLSSDSKADMDLITEWCGTYRAKTESWSGSGKNRSKTVGYEDKPIVKANDLMTLAGSGELILISNISGYSRIKKTPYYMDPFFKIEYDKVVCSKKGNKENDGKN